MAHTTFQLVCMPYQTLALAPLSLPLLAGVLREEGIETRESYFNFRFAELAGWKTYFGVAEGGMKSGFAGELLFAEAYWGSLKEEAAERLVEETFGNRAARTRLIEAFRKYCIEEITRVNAGLVGFTTSSNQLLASLWLARLVKERAPSTRTILGGAACGQPMGEQIKRHYEEID